MTIVMIPRTRAYSAMVSPSSACSPRRTILPFMSVAIPLDCGISLRGLEKAGDAVERLRDPTLQRGEREDNDDCDHGENHAVLGHRLALFLLPVGADELEPV